MRAETTERARTLLQCLGLGALLRWVQLPYSYGVLWWLDGVGLRVGLVLTFCAVTLLTGLGAMALSGRAAALDHPRTALALTVLNLCGLGLLEAGGLLLPGAAVVYLGCLASTFSEAGLLLLWAWELAKVRARYRRSCTLVCAVVVSLVFHVTTATLEGAGSVVVTVAATAFSGGALVASMGLARRCGPGLRHVGRQGDDRVLDGATLAATAAFSFTVGFVVTLAGDPGEGMRNEFRPSTYAMVAVVVVLAIVPVLRVIRSERYDVGYAMASIFLTVAAMLFVIGEDFVTVVALSGCVASFIVSVLFTVLSLADEVSQGLVEPLWAFGEGLAAIALGLLVATLVGPWAVGNVSLMLVLCLLPVMLLLVIDTVRGGPSSLLPSYETSVVEGFGRAGAAGREVGSELDPEVTMRGEAVVDARSAAFDEGVFAPEGAMGSESPATMGGRGAGVHVQDLAERWRLSSRECDVLELMLRGWTLQAIADGLFLSYGTVKTHTRHIYEKAAVHTRQQLIELVEGAS